MSRYQKPEPGKPQIIEVADRLMEIKFTLGALKEMDAKHDISVFKGDGLGGVFQDPERLAIVLYYGLRTKQPDITLEWVQDNVDASMLMDLLPVLIFGTTGRWPDLDKALAQADPNRAPVPIGSPSGVSDGTI